MIHLQNYLIDQQMYNIVSLVRNNVIWIDKNIVISIKAIENETNYMVTGNLMLDPQGWLITLLKIWF